MGMDFVVVTNTWDNKAIGAVGFIGDKIAAIIAFYDDKDANKDGKVGMAERIFSFGNMNGKAVAEVANHAYANPDISTRDPSLYNLRGKLTTQFAANLVAEGIYKTYFAMGIGKLAGAAAGAVTSNAVKSFVLKKGMEKAVEQSYREAMGI